MSTKIETIEQRRYSRLAGQILDRLAVTGEVRVWQVADTGALRAAVRREARGRQVKLSTWHDAQLHYLVVWQDPAPGTHVAGGTPQAMGVSPRTFWATYGHLAFRDPTGPLYISAGEVTA